MPTNLGVSCNDDKNDDKDYKDEEEGKAVSVLVVLTAHRHLAEVRLAAAFARRALERSTGVLGAAYASTGKGVDVLLHCNNAAADASELRAALAAFPARRRCLLLTARNAGYALGPLQQVQEALVAVARRFGPEAHDFVVHLHPDVYVTDAGKLDALLAAELEGRNGAPAALLVNRLHPAHVMGDAAKAGAARAAGAVVPAFSFDFFVVRPALLRADVFGAWEDAALVEELRAAGTPYPEFLLHEAVVRYGVPHRVFARHEGGAAASREGARFVDAFGLWHSHDNAKVERFLRREGAAVPPPASPEVAEAAVELLPPEVPADSPPAGGGGARYWCAACGDGGVGEACMRCAAYGGDVAAVAQAGPTPPARAASAAAAAAAAALVLVAALVALRHARRR